MPPAANMPLGGNAARNNPPKPNPVGHYGDWVFRSLIDAYSISQLMIKRSQEVEEEISIDRSVGFSLVNASKLYFI
jgi:hypothetical protein